MDAFTDESCDEFDHKATSSQYETFTVRKTTTTSFSVEDAYAVSSDANDAVLHNHDEVSSEEVQNLKTTCYTEALDLNPDSEAVNQLTGLWSSTKQVKERNFTISGVRELHELLKSEEKYASHAQEGVKSIADEETVLHLPHLHPSTDEEVDGSIILGKWKRENTLLLEEKERFEKSRLAITIRSAEEYRKEFCSKRWKRTEVRKQCNREKEESFITQQAEFHARAAMNYWKAVAELIPKEMVDKDKKKENAAVISAGPKPGKTTDLTRMRQLIIKLKNMTNPSVAASA